MFLHSEIIDRLGDFGVRKYDDVISKYPQPKLIFRLWGGVLILNNKIFTITRQLILLNIRKIIRK